MLALSDFPWLGRPVRITVRAGRWRCTNPGCSRRIFAERIPAIASSHWRSRRWSDGLRYSAQAASNASAVWQEARWVSTCVTLNGEGAKRFSEGGGRRGGGPVDLEGKAHVAGSAFDRDVQIELANLTIAILKLGRCVAFMCAKPGLYVLLTVRLASALGGREGGFSLQDAVDGVPVQMRQEVADDEGAVIERESGPAVEHAQNSALLNSRQEVPTAKGDESCRSFVSCKQHSDTSPLLACQSRGRGVDLVVGMPQDRRGMRKHFAGA